MHIMGCTVQPNELSFKYVQIHHGVSIVHTQSVRSARGSGRSRTSTAAYHLLLRLVLASIFLSCSCLASPLGTSVKAPRGHADFVISSMSVPKRHSSRRPWISRHGVIDRARTSELARSTAAEAESSEAFLQSLVFTRKRQRSGVRRAKAASAFVTRSSSHTRKRALNKRLEAERWIRSTLVQFRDRILQREHKRGFLFTSCKTAGQPGCAGETGKTGNNGVPGTTGAPGLAGQPGEMGPLGKWGKQGPPGLVGHTGPVGPQGVEGDAGSAGPKGGRGKVGPPGELGVRSHDRNGCGGVLGGL